MCVAFVAVAGRRYTYTVCTYYLPADTEIGIVTTFRTIVAPCSQIPDTSTKRMYQAHDAEEASRGRSWPRQRTHPRNHGSHKPRRACGGADGPRASREPLSLSLSLSRTAGVVVARDVRWKCQRRPHRYTRIKLLTRSLLSVPSSCSNTRAAITRPILLNLYLRDANALVSNLPP